MRQYNFAAALLVAVLLAGCGGGGSGGNQAPKVSFTSEVTFGDSLSDVGTYAVGTITALGGGGQYTINGTGKNWTELMAAQLGLPAPCAAQTGLNGSATYGFSVPVVNHASCTDYAQGGARVTNAVGPGNALLGGANAILGQLTVPITTQIDNHLTAVGGKFSGSEIVFMMAGANDVFMELATYAATVAASPGSAAAAATTAVTNMATAATQLAGYVNTKIIANGARYVVVVNMPDVSSTPFAAAQELAAPGTKAFINTLVTTFNSQLQTLLAGNSNVLFVDAYTVHRDEVTNPAAYSLSNVTTPACNLTISNVTNPTNPIGSSLMCNAGNLSPGVNSNYLFSDSVHPTPYGYLLLARLVSKDMLVKGWL
ncbi:GDSL-like lipase/acylhydrolase [mine drainage metagenome]|uniref:GDSL-like lipase/acylhydrolase n=1 Tax=mine drainage metagenome TaxID=410659 RepID=A0A1J5SM30_9ZZZZ